ncbi:hypothetical protein BWQ96_04941 [Gracilariopsis chorda]|uniref:Uncharacterized protein n=1 Tax=Gracilariopsis chorda TaxID=448386 RepID=A0A2V3IVY6_9FLOR|nr:hypothetical protein BWQ96_04941 [Gracilariopsis chorda]|eukprot:PXF45300.1 hypothetical protein BWQ96_04941 [Gracilariopsis chorda]
MSLWKTFTNGAAPDDAVQGGTEKNGNKVFVARAEIGGELTPGKMVREAGGAFIPWGGKENSFFTYELLTNPKNIELRWEPGQMGSVPDSSVIGGKTKSGEPEFVGRAEHEGIMVPGKMIKSHGGVLFPYGGKEVGATTYEVLVYPFAWKEASRGDVPEGAIQGGEEKNGNKVYVARAEIGGELTPGKMVKEAGGAFIPWGGEENSFFTYEVLTNPTGIEVTWVQASMGEIPPNAVVGGKTSSGEPEFVGRADHEGIKVPGKMIKSHGGVLFPYGGKEIGATTYEVLCVA